MSDDQGYTPPAYNKVSITLQPEQNQVWNRVSINLTPDSSGGDGGAQYIGGDGFGIDSQQLGQANIRLSFEYLRPTGIASSFKFGTASIRRAAEFIKPNGLNALSIGIAKVDNFHRRISLVGIFSQVFGTAKVYNLKSYIQVNSINPPIYDYKYLPKVELADRTISVTGIAPPIPVKDPGKDNKHLIAFGVRYMPMKGYEATLFGKAGIYYNPRYLEPRGIFDQYNAEHKVSPKIIIYPEGFVATRFGSRIIPESQSIYPFGFAEQFGQQEVHNYTQYVIPKGFLTSGILPEYRWGNTYAYNLKQIIIQEEASDSGLFPPASGQPGIINRNRRITTHGHESQRFGYQVFENGARVLGPAGIASPIEVEPTSTFIADRIRSVRTQSVEPPLASRWHLVLNAASQIKGQGFNAALFGSAHLQNTRRYFRFISGGEMTEFGKPMISDAIRQVEADPFYAIQAPVVPMPKVFLSRQYLEPVPFESLVFGWQESYIRWNKIFPRFDRTSVVGEPIVKNRNFHPATRGFDNQSFGIAKIENAIRTIQQHSVIATLMGRPTIGDSKRYLEVGSIKPPELSRFAEVYEIGTGHYPVKRILPTGIELKSFMGVPKVLQNNIIVENEGPFTRFGTANVRFMGARVEPGIWEMNWGVPRVEYKTRRIYPEGKDFMAFFPERQTVMFISAHTIYAATKTVPNQAVRNHEEPRLPLHNIDGYDPMTARERLPGAIFGTAKIDHYHRFLKPGSIQAIKMTDPEIRNTHHLIAPKGLNALRMGMISPLGDQTILIRSGITSSNTFGRLAVRNNLVTPDKIKPNGLNALSFGANKIEHLNRTLRLTGFNSLQMGVSRSNDTPFMWQSLHVGPPVPMNVGGDDHQLFGNTWISHYVREVVATGNDFAIVNEYDLTAFAHRMKVWNAEKYEPSRQAINPIGFDNLKMKVSNIRHQAYYIRPDGNSETFRKSNPSGEKK